MNIEKPPFWSVPIGEMVVTLRTDLYNGLASEEAKIRLRSAGENILEAISQTSNINLLMNQFRSPFMALLLFADILSFFLGEQIDAIIILCIIIFSGFLSFWQEKGAKNIVMELMAMVKVTTRVVRDGNSYSIALENLVPGDIISLSAGDVVPADCLLFEANDLFVNEAMLTGEPYPEEKKTGKLGPGTILKDRTNSLFKGTHITSGYAKALVILTGKETEFGKMADKIKSYKAETDFERGLRKFGYMLMQIALIMALVIFAVNIYFEKPFIDSLLFSLTLAIGVTPFLLPAIVSINLAYGARLMASQKVVVKRLVSIENFGSMNVFCSDKTGTLTSGEIHIHDYADIHGLKNGEIIDMAYINAMYQTGYANPIDEAIKQQHELDLTQFKKLDEVPFDFTRKRLSILVTEKDVNLMVAKGTYKKIMEVCTEVDNNGQKEAIGPYRKKINVLFEEYTKKGLRIIAVAYKRIEENIIDRSSENGMTFLGMIFLDDPVKAGAVESVARMNRLGIKLKILTGDNKNISLFVGKQLGISENKVLTGAELNKLDDIALMKKVNEIDIFAELEPSHKERIVNLISKSGNVVGYIGDGINDVSAIQAADVGISVENAVDVAKNTADFILLEKDLKVLINGIITGRKTFVNTIKYIFMTTSANFGNITSMAFISLFLPFLPLLPKQILATNFISDIPAMTIPSDNVDEDWIAIPKNWNLNFIKKFMVRFGLLSSIFDFLTFAILIYIVKSDTEVFRSGWFMVTILTEFVVLWVLRSKKVFYKGKPGRPLFFTTMGMFILGIGLSYTPLGTILELSILPWETMLMLLGVVILYGISNEILKKYFYKKFHF